MQKNLHSIDIPCTATKICLCENSESLVVFVATWDGKLLSIKYDEKRETIVCQQEIDITKDRLKPVLAVAELDNIAYVSAQVSEEEWAIYKIEFTGDNDFDRKKQSIIVGTHPKPINQLVIGEDKRLYSFGYDGVCNVWNLNEIHSFPMKSYELGKIVTQVQKKEAHILCVLEGESFALINTEDTQKEPVYFTARSEHLKNSQITSLAINKFVPDDPSRDDILDFALGTVEGRVIHCEYSLAERPGEKLKSQNPKAGGVVYAHQTFYKDQQISFPVNAIAYHISFDGLLFSGGSEGKIKFHDFPVQKVYKSLFEDCMPVSHLLTSSSGEYVVVAKGYGWHHDENKIFGKNEQEKAKIFIYILEENDMPS